MNNKHIKNIIILGGTYFAGRAFTELLIDYNNEARGKEDEASLINIVHINRGTVSVKIRNLNSVVSDRRDYDNLEKQLEKGIADGLVPADADVVVDFCGYQEGDIENISVCFRKCGISFKHYIFISTVDVLEHGTGKILNEEASYEYRPVEGDTGLYIAGKKALEKELIKTATDFGFKYTILRPTFIYGPGNYAPRESIYFKWIKLAGEVLFPVDADGSFQMVYVYDLAKIIWNCCQSDKSHNQIYNICGDKVINYRTFTNALEKGIPDKFGVVDITVDDCISGDVPMPFPMMAEESNLYEGSKISEIFDGYTDLATGLAITYSFFQQ